MNREAYRLVAHRGLHDNGGGIPENSIPAFRRAIEKGRAIELDVRLTADGQAVVFHDKSTLRMTGREMNIDQASWAELRTLRLLGTGWGIPLLSQVLQLVAGSVPLVVELKCPVLPGRLSGAVWQQLKDYGGEWVMESFHPLSVWWYKKNAPKIPRGILGDAQTNRGPIKGLILRPWVLTHLLGADFVAYDIDGITPAQAKSWHRAGKAVLGWTIATPQQLAKAERLCDGLIYEGLDL